MDSRHLRITLSRALTCGKISVCSSSDMAGFFLSQMTPVKIVSRAGAFGGNHGRSQRMLRRARPAKRRAVGRLLDGLQDLAADASGWLVGFDLFYFEKPPAGMIAKVGTQPR